MAPTKSAGRVSIRVLPDSTRFREDLRTALERIERNMKVNIPVHLVLDNKQLQEIKKRIEALAIKIKPAIDLTVPADEIERIKQQIEAMDPEVNVDMKLNTAGAAARIAALTRDRVIRIWPKVMMENFTKHLAALGGAGYIIDQVEKGVRWLREVDKHAVALAKQAVIIGGVVAAAGGLLQVIWALGDGLIQTTGLLSVAPALLSSMGIATAVFIVAMRDMKEVLADLGPAFGNLRQSMSSAFWANAAQPIRDMVNHFMPSLTEKITESSRAMGNFTGKIAASYQQHVTLRKFELMFDRINESMWTMEGAVDPIIRAFTNLGMHGTLYLNRLSKAIVKLAEDFDAWIQKNYDNGNLALWTEQAIRAFKDLGGIIKGVWDVFGALNTAIKAAGGPTLASLHKNLDNLATMMKGPQFQGAITHVFKGINNALKEILTGVGELGIGFADLAPHVEKAFGSVGRSLRMVLSYLGEIIGHPAFRKGFDDLFKGIENGIASLKPAIGPTAVAVGSLMTLIGSILENIGELIAIIMIKWGPALQRLSDEFDSLADPIGDLFKAVVSDLAPAFNALVDDVLIPLLGWIKSDLIPGIKDFAREMGPELVPIIKETGKFLMELMPVLLWLAGALIEIVKAVIWVVEKFNDLTRWLTNYRGGYTLGDLNEEFEDLGWYLGEFVNIMGSALGSAGGALETFGRGAQSAMIFVRDVMSGNWGQIQANTKSVLDTMGIDTTNAWTTISSTARALWTIIKDDIRAIIDNLKQSIKDALGLIGIDIDGKWTEIKDSTSRKWQEIKQEVLNKINELYNSLPDWMRSIIDTISRGWGDASAGARRGASEMNRGVSQEMNSTVSTTSSMPARLAGIFNGFSLFHSGYAIIQSFANGLWGAFNTAYSVASTIMARIRALFPFSPAKEGPFSGKGYTTHSGAALVDGFAEGMLSRMSSVRTVAKNVMGSVASHFDVGPDGELGVETTTDGKVTLHVYNPIAEPTSRTIARASSEIKLGGKL